jgi:ElaB/YqjD/DUF883 family membrane-anchored ribosome-binding protein
MARYETPNALRHDAHTLAEDARALLDATSEITDQKIAEARQRLTNALNTGNELCDRLQEKAYQGAEAVDQAVRSHPYQALAISFGLGALVSYLITRRD